jgi:hypothetical protein
MHSIETIAVHIILPVFSWDFRRTTGAQRMALAIAAPGAPSLLGSAAMLPHSFPMVVSTHQSLSNFKKAAHR